MLWGLSKKRKKPRMGANGADGAEGADGADGANRRRPAPTDADSHRRRITTRKHLAPTLLTAPKTRETAREALRVGSIVIVVVFVFVVAVVVAVVGGGGGGGGNAAAAAATTAVAVFVVRPLLICGITSRRHHVVPRCRALALTFWGSVR